MAEVMLFHLERHTDESGVSGTGRVAHGIVWPDGTVGMRWDSEITSFGFYESLERVRAIHGHSGKTKIVIDVAVQA